MLKRDIRIENVIVARNLRVSVATLRSPLLDEKCLKYFPGVINLIHLVLWGPCFHRRGGASMSDGDWEDLREEVLYILGCRYCERRA